MTLTDNPDLLRNSVTREDAKLLATQGRALYLNLPSTGGFWGINDIGPLPPELPAPWSRYADRWLSATLLAETMWAAAVQKAITKRTARGWTIKDSAKSERRTTWSQNLLLQSQNRAGWVSYMTRTLRDFILCDNGTVSEIIRAKAGAGSRILGIQHLDAMRIWRTGDAQWPVIYEDLMGGMHPMRDYQIMSMVDMESPRAEARGTGICAGRRAYQTIYYAMVLQQYGSEKVSGTAPKEVHIVNGIDITQWDDATTTAQEERRQRGNRRYQGVVVVPLLAMNATPDGYRIPISEIPEGWNVKEERDNIYLLYAASLGMAAQALKPLSGQGLGTGAQSTNLDEDAKEEGLAAFDKQFEHQVGDRVFPTSTTFAWTAHDLRDQRIKADIDKTRAETREIMATKIGEITAQQSAQLAADTGAIPDTFLPSDETPTDELTDSEKPEGEAVEGQVQEDAPVLPTMRTEERRARLVERARGKTMEPDIATEQQAIKTLATVMRRNPRFSHYSNDDIRGAAIDVYGSVLRGERVDVANIVDGPIPFDFNAWAAQINTDYTTERKVASVVADCYLSIDGVAFPVRLDPTAPDGVIRFEAQPRGTVKATRLTVADLDADAAMEAARALIAEVRG